MVEPFLVLAVDDHAGSRFAVSSALMTLPGVKVIEAASGEDALRICLEASPHLILLDAHMPGMDGYEVADHLRMASRTRNIPIIFLTGIYKSDEFVRRGYGVGAVDYLLKPVEESLLINRVRFYQFLTDQERKLGDMVDQLRVRDTELSTERDRAEAANRAKDSFLAAMSHEIRTPLNAILGSAHMLIQHAQPDQLNALNNIMLSGRHLLIIINDILDLAKIEANKLRLEARGFRLVTLMETVRSMISVGAAAKGLAIEVEIAPGTPSVLLGDANRLRQALLNYASNALKFTETGSITLRVERIAGKDSQATLRFEVEDTGYGIDAETQAELFKPFSQGTAPQSGGTGLGLAITRRLAQLMNGDAGVRSTKGVGSLFWFTVELDVGEESPALDEATGEEALQRLRGLPSSRRVLLVEDNVINAEIALNLLNVAGLSGELAEDGRAAIDMVQQRHYDLILMDMHMPRMNGLEATQAIRALPSRHRPPIVAMTANAFDDDRRKCAAAGMDDFLSKPVEPSEMYTILLRWLERA